MPKNCNLCWGPDKVFFRPYVANPEDNDDLQNVPIQLSVHSVSAVSYLRELTAVFPNLKNIKEATIICSMQNASKDLAGVGFAIEGEKDVLLERVMGTVSKIDLALSSSPSCFIVHSCCKNDLLQITRARVLR